MTNRDKLLALFEDNRDMCELMMNEDGYYEGKFEYPSHVKNGEEGTFDDAFKALGYTNATTVEHYGGEDCGRDYYAVWKFTHKDGSEVILKFEGWYASHYGSEFECVFEVKPVTKEVTVYE